MNSRSSKTIYGLIVLAVFAFVGCQQKSRQKQVVYEPLRDPNFVVPDYAMEVMDTTGGRTAWAKAKKLQLDCVLTVYTSDGSFYLTEQHHEISPWLASIWISAIEPEGKLIWQLSPDGFSESEAASGVDVSGLYFASAILDATTAPVRLLDSSATFVKGPETVKIEGRWYYPIRLTTAGKLAAAHALGDVSSVVYYQDADSSLVDMFLLTYGNETNALAVRSYDYREVDDGGIRLPRKIEIFSANPEYGKMRVVSPGETGEFLKQRIATIDYYSFDVAKD